MKAIISYLLPLEWRHDMFLFDKQKHERWRKYSNTCTGVFNSFLVYYSRNIQLPGNNVDNQVIIEVIFQKQKRPEIDYLEFLKCE